jgi:translation initiation factor 1
MGKKSGLVYSTEHGRLCPGCGQPETRCQCGPTAPPEGDGWVRIMRSNKGRGGKTVSIISGLGLSGSDLKTLAKQLKQQCGVGGAVKDFDIEIQGDQREKIKTYLESKGYQVKLAGG